MGALQWVRGCLAVSMESALLMVEVRLGDGLKEIAENRPTDLTGRLVIGGLSTPRGWVHSSNKVPILTYSLLSWWK